MWSTCAVLLRFDIYLYPWDYVTGTGFVILLSYQNQNFGGYSLNRSLPKPQALQQRTNRTHTSALWTYRNDIWIKRHDIGALSVFAASLALLLGYPLGTGGFKKYQQCEDALFVFQWPEKYSEQTIEMSTICDAMMLMWSHHKAIYAQWAELDKWRWIK